MDRIRPRTEQNILLRRDLPITLTSVCYEIGVYGAYVRYSTHRDIQHECGINDTNKKESYKKTDCLKRIEKVLCDVLCACNHDAPVTLYRHGGEMVLNEVCGDILRTKNIEHNDAGIIGGVTVFDNALLI